MGGLLRLLLKKKKKKKKNKLKIHFSVSGQYLIFLCVITRLQKQVEFKKRRTPINDKDAVWSVISVGHIGSV